MVAPSYETRALLISLWFKNAFKSESPEESVIFPAWLLGTRKWIASANKLLLSYTSTSSSLSGLGCTCILPISTLSPSYQLGVPKFWGLPSFKAVKLICFNLGFPWIIKVFSWLTLSALIVSRSRFPSMRNTLPGPLLWPNSTSPSTSVPIKWSVGIVPPVIISSNRTSSILTL